MGIENKENQDSFEKLEQYQKLISDLKSIIEDAKAKGVDLFERLDELRCSDCGAYEDSSDGFWQLYDINDERTGHDTFIIVDAKERSFNRADMCHCITTYSYICPCCGLWQTAITRDKFEDVL